MPRGQANVDHGWKMFADQDKLSAYCVFKPEDAVEPGMLPIFKTIACGLIYIAQLMGFEVMRSDVRWSWAKLGLTRRHYTTCQDRRHLVSGNIFMI